MAIKRIVKTTAGVIAWPFKKRLLNEDVQAVMRGTEQKRYKLNWNKIKKRHLKSKETLSRFLREYAKEAVRKEQEQKWIYGQYKTVSLERIRTIEKELNLPARTVELSLNVERKRQEIKTFEKTELNKAKAGQRKRLETLWKQQVNELQEMEKEIDKLVSGFFPSA